MTKIHKKKYMDKNVYEMAKERIRYLYQNFDDVVVSFSGGKDSTAMLLCCIDVARELGRLPVSAFFYDEEALHPPTVDYVARVKAMPEVNLDWYCLPVKHRNACSNEQPFWYCWNPDEKDLWCRSIPDCAITEHSRFSFGMAMQDFGIEHYRNTNKVVIQGIRTEESLRRYRAVAMKKDENFISKPDKGVFFAYPIYDWSSEDVWRLVKIKDADYNRTYDIFNRSRQYGMLLKQRVCPPYGEEPLRGLDLYAECFPELWAKMINRVKGAATAARYGNTELYSQGYKPDQTSWRAHVQNVLDTFNGKGKAQVASVLNQAIRHHKNLTNDAVPEEQPHPLSGVSWMYLSKIVTRGDFKGRIIQNLAGEAIKAQMQMGITKERAKELYGKLNNEGEK
jgi:predicted phosphoadenosine phosphosulfate sulfurtransferase